MLQIRLLGVFEVEIDDRQVEDADWTRRKERQLLQLLALSPRGELHREQVMEALWPGSTIDSAANNLNKTVHGLRRLFEPALNTGSESSYLLRLGDVIRLQSPNGIQIDVHEFTGWASQGLKGSDKELLERALQAYRGPLLPGSLYDDWCWAQRQHLESLWRDLCWALISLYQEHQQLAPATELLKLLLENEATDEAAHRELIRLWAIDGQRTRALAQYEQCRQILRRELEADPSPATRQLLRDVQRGELEPENRPENEPGRSPAKQVTAIHTLAVLPFSNESSDSQLEYFCDGLTESLINRLSHLSSLKIMARSTVFRYKNSPTEARAVGSELGVGAVVVGRVLQWSDRLVIGVELVNVEDGSLLWGQQYNRVPGDIFLVQEEISREISDNLKFKLTGMEALRLEKRHTDNERAFEFYLKGRFHWNKRTGVGLTRAINYFERAIEEDPAYALAYSGLADAHNLLSLYGLAPPQETMERAKAAAAKSLEIDDHLSEAHSSLAYALLYYDWQWSEAEHEFKRSIELNPNYSTAHHWYHEFLTAMGRFAEAQAEIEKARQLDPLSLIINTDVGWGLYYSRQYERAVDQLRRVVTHDPHFAVVHFVLGLVHLQLKEFDLAVGEIEEGIGLLEGSPFPLAIGVLGHAYAASGQRRKAELQAAHLDRLAEKAYVSSYSRALIEVGLNEYERALTSLEAAIEERTDRLIYLRVEPIFDSLRSDSRFQQSLRRIGLV